MEITKVIIYSDLTYSAVIGGKHKFNITTESRFYQQIQDWISDGNTPDPEFTPEEELANAKVLKISAIERETRRRVIESYPGRQGAITAINAMNSIAAVNAYDPVNTPSWPKS